MAILAIFLTLNVTVLLTAVPGGHYQPDTGDYDTVTRALVKHGAFVDLSHPQKPTTTRQPGYPLVLLAGRVLGQGEPALPVVVLQLCALFLTGLITRQIVNDWLPGYGNMAMALVVFNPNALGIAHVLLPMTLFTLAFTAAIWAALAFARTPGLRSAVLLGLFIGLACLFRAEPKYLIPVIPLALPLLAALCGHGRKFLRHAAAGLVAVAVALAVVSPWVAHNYDATGRLSISGGRIASSFLISNLAYLEKRLNPSLTVAEAKTIVAEKANARIVKEGAGWDALDENEKQSRLFRIYLELIPEYPATTLLEAAATSQIKLFASGGAQNLHGLLGVQVTNSHQVFDEGGHGNRISAWLAAMRTASAGAWAVTLAALGFVVVMRLLGLLGIGVLVAHRHWALMLITGAVILYWVLIVLINGTSRYRVPLEPLLMILAVYGIAGLRASREQRAAGRADQREVPRSPASG